MSLMSRAGSAPMDDSPLKTRRARGRRIFLVATPGGHLDLLLAIRGAFADFERVWVVSPGSTADALLADGEQISLVPRFHGYSPRNLGHALHSLQPLIQGRPSLVVTS